MVNRKMLVRSVATLVALCLLIALTSAAALAHDGPPRLELNTDRIPPGATLEVRGVNLASDESINLTLIGNGSEFPLGVAMTDAHGDFTQAFALPTELTEGAYIVRASKATGPVAEAPLTVFGPAVSAEDEGGQREEEDGLLAPMPTVIKARVSNSEPQPSISTADAMTTSKEDAPLAALPVVLLGAITAGVAIVIRRQRHV